MLCWLVFQRFGMNEQSLGELFFVVVCSMQPHLGAAWLAKVNRLVNTMVFTHLPSTSFF
jgi:hypothetical protein